MVGQFDNLQFCRLWTQQILVDILLQHFIANASFSEIKAAVNNNIELQ